MIRKRAFGLQMFFNILKGRVHINPLIFFANSKKNELNFDKFAAVITIGLSLF